MAMKQHPKPTDQAGHSGQPHGSKVVHEGAAFKQKVGKNRADPPSHGKLKEGDLTRNADQPHGGAHGLPEKAQHMPESHRISAGGVSYGQFPSLSMKGADCFKGTAKKGALRVSGHSGAHMLGSKKR